MKYLETKHERNSAKITTLIVMILLLLLFIVGPPYMDPPLEYGVAVNFGTTDFGSGKVQPTEPIKSQPKEVVEETNIEETKVEETKVEETKQETSEANSKAEDVMTEESPESIAIKKQKEAEAKEKSEAERVEKEKKAAEERAEKKRKAAEEKKRKEEAAKKKSIDALIGGVSKSDGTKTGGEGPDSKPGDKGQLDGNPYAPSYFGDPGSGSGGKNYGLNGRGRPTNGKILPDCEDQGLVVVEVRVNRQGKVIKAIPGKKGTTGTSCLFEAAKKTALTFKWPADSKAPSEQVGWITIDFSLGQ